jgi:histone-binding protein RBBP4
MNDDETHNRLVLEEYKIWKRATPFLYDVIVSHTLEWPVAHAHWLPQRRTDANGIHVQRLALASHRSILLADARLPCVPIDLSDPQFHPSVHDAAAITSVSFSDNDLTATTEGALGKLEIVQRIDAPAPVRCVRANPNAPWLLAARLADGGDSLIYDSSALPPRPPLIALSSKPPASSASTSSTPLLRLRGHDLAGGALSWSPCRANTLASVGADGRICIFDVSAAMSTANSAVSESAQAFDSPRKGTKAIAPKSSTSSAGSGLAAWTGIIVTSTC